MRHGSPYFAKGLAPSIPVLISVFLCSKSILTTSPLTIYLCKFVIELANSSLKHQSIKWNQTSSDFCRPSKPFTHAMLHLKLVLRGVKHHRAECGTKSRIHLPITPDILRSLQSYWLSSDFGQNVPMLWAGVVYASLASSGQGRFIPLLTHYMTQVAIYLLRIP